MRHPHLYPLPSRERKLTSSLPIGKSIGLRFIISGPVLRASVQLLTPKNGPMRLADGSVLFSSRSADRLATDAVEIEGESSPVPTNRLGPG